ncbi:MAG: hypothetical protein A2Y38_11685 [Spirochaetes bacterium GWB1_59_5]|nr:MAG: hypothetical protein A2Y38_11685 [Spirochaetes bacterium GWB1_59_5]
MSKRTTYSIEMIVPVDGDLQDSDDEAPHICCGKYVIAEVSEGGLLLACKLVKRANRTTPKRKGSRK